MAFTSDLIAHLPRPLVDALVKARRQNAVFRRWSDYIVDRLRGYDILVRQGLAKGLTFSSGCSNVGFTFAEHALEPDTERAIQISLKHRMIFYDVGANFGWLSLIAARIVGPYGKVLSFEPLDSNVRIIQHNVQTNEFANVQILPIALGETDGRGRFLCSSQPSWGMLAATGREPGEFIDETTVTVRRLDTAVREYRLSLPDVIKIDVEGAEINALRGAADTLASSRPFMLIELHETNAAVADFLTGLNYQCSLPGSSVPISDAPGNVHVFAVPAERNDCKDMIQAFRDPSFPQCIRCREIGRN